MKQLLTTFTVISIVLFACKKKDVGPPPSIPVVTTAALTNVNMAAGTATGGGSIVTDGGAAVTQSGIVWSKVNATPTLTDSVIAGTTSSGIFTNNITGLDFSNTYYFRAFATNSIGTGYGGVETLTTSSDSVRFTYNGQSVTYGIFISPTTGKKWLDRNIGAKQVATAFNDYLAYGDIFQWGRPADGHQLIVWTANNASWPNTAGTVSGTTTTLATSDNPGHSNFIIGDPFGTADWRSDNNSNRWNTNPQGPCPAGWHVPTKVEWQAEVPTSKGGTATSGGIINYNTGYSLLKLTVAGFRAGTGDSDPAAGQLWRNGERGFYWSSSDDFSNGVNSQAVYFVVTASNAQIPTTYKSQGFSVRCIKD